MNFFVVQSFLILLIFSLGTYGRPQNAIPTAVKPVPRIIIGHSSDSSSFAASLSIGARAFVPVATSVSSSVSKSSKSASVSSNSVQEIDAKLGKSVISAPVDAIQTVAEVSKDSIVEETAESDGVQTGPTVSIPVEAIQTVPETTPNDVQTEEVSPVTEAEFIDDQSTRVETVSSVVENKVAVSKDAVPEEVESTTIVVELETETEAADITEKQARSEVIETVEAVEKESATESVAQESNTEISEKETKLTSIADAIEESVLTLVEEELASVTEIPEDSDITEAAIENIVDAISTKSEDEKVLAFAESTTLSNDVAEEETTLSIINEETEIDTHSKGAIVTEEDTTLANDLVDETTIELELDITTEASAGLAM